jgi:hypothetical protein
MTNQIPRLAASVFTALFAVAVLSVSTAHAAVDEPISTTCGAGTLEHCGTKPLVDCDWVIEFGYSGGYAVQIKIGRTNCRVTGFVPIYKNMHRSSSLSGSCSMLNPFLGMPSGSGCSDDDET